jgi:hypothetical protein
LYKIRKEFPLRSERAHLGIKIGFRSSDPEPRQVRQRYVSVFHARAIRETAIGLEHVRIAFIAAEPLAGGDVERHLMAAMRMQRLQDQPASFSTVSVFWYLHRPYDKLGPLVIIAAQDSVRPEVLAVGSSSEAGSASRMRGAKRSRINPPCP